MIVFQKETRLQILNICDFNAKSKKMCSSDKATYEGKKLQSLTSQCGFKQVISGPTHIL